jgi:uncharacterized protein YjbI with pentapeptide repeats
MSDYVFSGSGLTFVIVVIFVGAVWWKFPIWQRRKSDHLLKDGSQLDARDLADLEDEYRKTCAQALGSIVLLLTVYIAYVQFMEGKQKITIDNANALLAKGYDLIGAKTAAQRTGGIHVLMQWADQDNGEPAHTQRLTQLAMTLVSLVRDQTRFKDKGITFGRCEEFRRPVAETIGSDLQLAIDELVRISKIETVPIQVNFQGLNLSRVDLSGASFKEANFAFSDLSDAELKNVVLKDSNFYCSNLRKAQFQGSDLTGTIRDDIGPQTNMAGADLTEAYMGDRDRRDKPAILRLVNLTSAVLDNVIANDIDLGGATLLNAKLRRAKLAHANFDGTIIDKACFIDAPTDAEKFRKARVLNEEAVVANSTDLAPDSPCRAETPLKFHVDRRADDTSGRTPNDAEDK